MADTKIRIAAPDDAAQLLDIYAPYVEKTAVSFEYTVPDLKEFADRITRILEDYPWLIAERNGKAAGYAYAGRFKDRAAYDWAVETTIYVREDQKRNGVGRALYQALEQVLSMQNFLNLNACIACPDKADNDDPYLTLDSMHFHEHSGYQHVGRFHRCGYKFGRWYDMIWMEKQIGTHTGRPEPVIPFSEIREQISVNLPGSQK